MLASVGLIGKLLIYFYLGYIAFKCAPEKTIELRLWVIMWGFVKIMLETILLTWVIISCKDAFKKEENKIETYKERTRL